MAAVFSDRIRVLAHECDFMGHVNNAAYVRYLQQATLDLFSRLNRVPPRTLRRLSIQPHQLPALEWR